MDWQQFLSLIIVAVTGLLLARAEVRKRRRARRTGCMGECGCASAAGVRTKLTKEGR
ncbi:MAG: hypothetical protein OEM41_00185 [Ignavibacteria bacterium]|nr:hypothetical protein [Ignavibacteria bacterium]